MRWSWLSSCTVLSLRNSTSNTLQVRKTHAIKNEETKTFPKFFSQWIHYAEIGGALIIRLPSQRKLGERLILWCSNPLFERVFVLSSSETSSHPSPHQVLSPKPNTLDVTAQTGGEDFVLRNSSSLQPPLSILMASSSKPAAVQPYSSLHSPNAFPE